MFKEIIVLSLIAYIIYRVLNRFVLPIFRMTSAASAQVRQMQEQMQAQMQDMDRKMNQQPINSRKAEKEGDYIEYEEVK